MNKLRLSLLVLLVILLCGCTTLTATIAPDKTVTMKYKYLLQNKTWTVVMPDGSKIDFNNNNQAITDLASAVKELAAKVPVTP